MGVSNGYQNYQENQALTASKGKLLLMAYDGAIRFLRQAQIYMSEKAYEKQNSCIIKAQRLILELICTLDVQANPELAHRLMLIYEYFFNRLTEANIRDDESALEEVIGSLSNLRSAWAEADRQVKQSEIAAEQEQYATL